MVFFTFVHFFHSFFLFFSLYFRFFYFSIWLMHFFYYCWTFCCPQWLHYSKAHTHTKSISIKFNLHLLNVQIEFSEVQLSLVFCLLFFAMPVLVGWSFSLVWLLPLYLFYTYTINVYKYLKQSAKLCQLIKTEKEMKYISISHKMQIV